MATQQCGDAVAGSAYFLVFLLPPIIDGETSGIPPISMPVEEKEVCALRVSFRSDAALPAERSVCRVSIGQVTGGPHIIEVGAPDNVPCRENRPPGSVLIVGKVNRFAGLLKTSEFVGSVECASRVVPQAGELPRVDDVTNHLPFIGISRAGVDLHSVVLVPLGRCSAEIWNV